ncbi:hypothetical protein [Kribbella qitaiheensis]|uniref:hypothetical protein n=1 Tax=Kribbella qitaiheensis TaxID=1544730 RepID=UPI00162699A3|nr:hypothetical protein [Kribbella qitaiheensis]
MIKRFLTVAGMTLLLAGSLLLSSGSARAGETPPVDDDPNGSCAAASCWQM